MRWILYKRGTIPLHRAIMVLLGVFKYAKKFQGRFVSTLYINEGEKLIWSWHKRQLTDLEQKLIRNGF